MSFDTVCWAVNGGGTDAAVARVLANIASQNTQGINLPGDMKVTQLGSPGAGVQIASGAATILCQQAPGESYVGIARSSTTQAIAPTGGSARSDLIVAYVIDPAFSPWSPYTTPTQILNGPYFQPGVIAGVANNTTAASQVVSYSALALARIDIPSSTSTITNAMIHDLRALSRPRNSTVYQWQSVASQQQLSSTTWLDWPNNSLSVQVPTWATTALATIRLNGPLGFGYSGGGSLNGVDAMHRVNFNGVTTGPVAIFDFNATTGMLASDAMAVPISMYGTFDCTGIQGQTIVVKPQAQRYNLAQHSNVMEMDTWHQVEFDIRFVENTV